MPQRYSQHSNTPSNAILSSKSSTKIKLRRCNTSPTCENIFALVPHNPFWLEKDHETALSAVRNLNNTDVGGRPLRIDLADSDPFLEGKTTVRGEIIDGGTPGPSEPRHGWRGGGGDSRHESIFTNLPPGIQIPQGASALDYISQTLATMQPSQLMEVLAQMKAFVITHPEQARTLLFAHPQFAYALFQALVLNKIVDSAILQRMLAATTGGTAPQAARPPVPPPHLQQPQHPQYPPPMPPQAYPPPPLQQPQPPMPALAPPTAPTLYGHHVPPPHASMPPPPMAPYGYRPPPPAQPMLPTPPTQTSQPPAPQPATPAAPPGISDDQRAMIMQVFALTQEQINAFPEAERAAIQQLRTQYSQLMNGVGA
ncbi:hypothetical protein C0992_001213 [Termitomyces sp. T32_za158]|nr:hypothetical protein C0992_001213 [Termitomyces sp. T32_za158]